MTLSNGGTFSKQNIGGFDYESRSVDGTLARGQTILAGTLLLSLRQT